MHFTQTTVSNKTSNSTTQHLAEIIIPMSLKKLLSNIDEGSINKSPCLVYFLGKCSIYFDSQVNPSFANKTDKTSPKFYKTKNITST